MNFAYYLFTLIVKADFFNLRNKIIFICHYVTKTLSKVQPISSMLHIGCQKNFPASTNILEVIDSRKAHKGLSKVRNKSLT